MDGAVTGDDVMVEVMQSLVMTVMVEVMQSLVVEVMVQ